MVNSSKQVIPSVHDAEVARAENFLNEFQNHYKQQGLNSSSFSPLREIEENETDADGLSFLARFSKFQLFNISTEGIKTENLKNKCLEDIKAFLRERD